MYYKNDLKSAYLILEGEEGEEEDYQVAMMQENEIPGLLKAQTRFLDNCIHYYYDISGMQSLKAKYEKEKLKHADIHKLIKELLAAMEEAKTYMLDVEKILLDPNYIYSEKDRYYFTYYPSCDLDIKEEFHKLTEFFVREVDYQDREGVHLAYTLHKSTMEEHYSIQKIMEDLKNEEAVPKIHYVERMEQQVEEPPIVAEKPDMWEPVKRLLERKKKEKWGRWDDIHIEEELL
jgi:hypothetical protein